MKVMSALQHQPAATPNSHVEREMRISDAQPFIAADGFAAR